MSLLTAKGRSEHAAYDTLSDDLARSLLDRLNGSQCDRLVAAMAEVETLMTAASVTIGVEPQDSHDAQQCLAAYFKELDERFEKGFDPTKGGYGGEKSSARTNRLLHDRAPERTCDRLRRVEAHRRLDQRDQAHVGRAGGRGGSAWPAACSRRSENQARQSSVTRIVLDTNKALTQAQALYRKAGYRETGRYNDNPYAHFCSGRNSALPGPSRLCAVFQ